MDGKEKREKYTDWLHNRYFFLSGRKWSSFSAKEMEGLSAVFKTNLHCGVRHIYPDCASVLTWQMRVVQKLPG